MITIRRTNERQHDQRHKKEVWLTFYPRDREDPLASGIGVLEILIEGRLAPGADAPRHALRDAEIVTYVREGTLAYEDSLGRSGMLQSGEFQHVSASRAIRHRQTNASRTDFAHIFQIWLRSTEPGRESGQQQKRFSIAERRAGLCVVGSPDGRRESLLLHQDAVLFSAVLDPGKHVIHELATGRRAFIHLVHGEATFADRVLTTGDGAGATGERAVSLTARQETEILLIDIAQSTTGG
jgi:redox-sensitive bicupin YhaK (pirin superfamily)